MNKNMGSGARPPGFESQFHHFLCELEQLINIYVPLVSLLQAGNSIILCFLGIGIKSKIIELDWA